MSSSKKEPENGKVKKLEDEILLMEYIKNGLCMRELNSSGRTFINKLQTERRHEIINIENEA